MHLTQFSDYALRVLLYTAQHPSRLVTINELARFHAISRSHLSKVVVHLSGAGFLLSVRGRGGGLRLGRPPQDIRIGDVLRSTEENMQLVECFGPASSCVLIPGCRLSQALQDALGAFMASLDKLTLADLAAPPATHEVAVVPVTLTRPARRRTGTGG